jgi:hypothetical protein
MTQWCHDMMVCMQASPEWIAWWNMFGVGFFVCSIQNVSGHPEDPYTWLRKQRKKCVIGGGGHPQDLDINIVVNFLYSIGIWGIFVVSDLLPWSAICCYLTGHKQCKHEGFQWPGSR